MILYFAQSFKHFKIAQRGYLWCCAVIVILAAWEDASAQENLVPRDLPMVAPTKVWDNTTLAESTRLLPAVEQESTSKPLQVEPLVNDVDRAWATPANQGLFDSLIPRSGSVPTGSSIDSRGTVTVGELTVEKGLMKSDPMAPATASEFANRVELRPEASAYRLEQNTLSFDQVRAGGAQCFGARLSERGGYVACKMEGVVEVPYQAGDFLGTPAPAEPYNPCLDTATYYGKYFVPVQRPWVEWWRPFYTGGIYDPAIPLFTDVNPLTPHFLVYGDYRAAVGVHRNNGKPVRSIANRLNLDFDLRLTGTERIHWFMGPLDQDNRFTRLDFSDSSNVRFEDELDAKFDTLFFEGDLGAMTGGLTGVDAPFDLPFTFGKVPLLYQNGIWMEDAINGAAVAFPWKNSPTLNWSNFDATFFMGFDQVTSPAFGNNNQAANVYGTAWFIEAYEGYIESDYAYLDDQQGLGRSYHNTAFAYTRRYWSRISNSIRVIGNLGQSGPRNTRTADGLLLLWENSLISDAPSNVVPYYNAFLGYGRPQSVARAAGSGGILRNTGINFESDNLTGYPTLDATGSNAYGGAVGINFLSGDFRRQIAVEFAALDTYGDDNLSVAPGAQYGVGTRWQKALNNWTLVRVDLMHGWLENASDIYGTRAEFRWKF